MFSGSTLSQHDARCKSTCIAFTRGEKILIVLHRTEIRSLYAVFANTEVNQLSLVCLPKVQLRFAR